MLKLLILLLIMPMFTHAETTRFYNARIVRDHELQNGDLWCRDGKIVPEQDVADVEVDVKGLIIAPGYIDLQINGAFGIDFSTNPEVQKVADLLLQYGVTSFLPTLVSLQKEQYHDLIPKLKGALGIHLEGPFFNPNKRGAHNPQAIQSLPGSLEEFYGTLEGVKIVTLAPELPGASEAIRELQSKGIVVSAGHTEATYDELNDVNMVTHLFNAMSPMNHRNPGIATAALTDSSIRFSIIADGVHVHPEIINLAWRSNPEGLFLVTDAIAALGLESGTYHLGGMEVEVRDNIAYVAGTKTLAGSTLSMDQAVRNFKKYTQCSLVEAIEAASYKPAKILGIENSLKEGADADFIILDDELNVQATYKAGKLVWSP